MQQARDKIKEGQRAAPYDLPDNEAYIALYLLGASQ